MNFQIIVLWTKHKIYIYITQINKFSHMDSIINYRSYMHGYTVLYICICKKNTETITMFIIKA